ncbi:MAG: DUF262 domain-containing protein [Fibrobacterales bacterium]|nr:DUF262 domain-containing protein [Fibrobacterales bacterium]
MDKNMLDEYAQNAISLADLLKNCDSVCIPRIQRAYAQGRKKEKLIRENFLSDILNALQKEEPLVLNFVYGPCNKGRFEVLDGQQRLTTLFLLHWYCANVELESIPEDLGKLRYETRGTSTDFWHDLASRKIKFSANPSRDIRGAKWFSHAYECDPTVDAMLRMLDAIHTHYQDLKRNTGRETLALYGKLDLLRFHHRSLKGFFRGDELYIKMNARGLPLTPFENFKADFADWLQQPKPGCSEDPTKECERIIEKIDMSWTAYYWRSSDGKNADAFLSSRLFRIFIRYLLYRRLTCNEDAAQTLQYDDAVRFLDDAAENQTDVYLGFEHFEDVLNKDPDSVRKLEHVLDLLEGTGDLPFEKFDEYLQNPHDPNSTWSCVGEKKKAFPRRSAIAFAAAMAYLEIADKFEVIGFQQWMRVVWNSIQNTDITDLRSQIGPTRALVALARTPGMTDDVYKTLASANDPAHRAIAEEIRKARMIVSLPEGRDAWETEIIAAERAQFFKGMIGFYIQDDLTLDEFRHRSEMVQKLFDDGGITEAYREHHRLLRAMLVQVPAWEYLYVEGSQSLSLTERLMTKNSGLRNLLARTSPIQEFFRRIAAMPNEQEMKDAIDSTVLTVPEFNAKGHFDEKGVKRLYELLVKDERILNWASAEEAKRQKSPVISNRYRHCCAFNFPSCKGAARIVLGEIREGIIKGLFDKGFVVKDGSDQKAAFDEYGYFTDYNVSVIKPAQGGSVTVTFNGNDGYISIMLPDGRNEQRGYDNSEDFQTVWKGIEAEFSQYLT